MLMKTKLTRHIAILTLALLAVLPAAARKGKTAGAATARAVETRVSPAVDSASRAVAAVMGPLINRNLTQIQGLGIELDRKVFIRALETYLEGGDIGFTDQSGDAYIEDRVRAARGIAPDTLSRASQQKFLAEAAKTDGAVTLPDGTVFIVVTEGEGAMPGPDDTVNVAYTGRLSDGSEFDSTRDDGPIDLSVSGVVPGFGEALQHVRPGGTYRIVIPADRAYGSRGIPGAIPGNAALDFTIEVKGVKRAQK